MRCGITLCNRGMQSFRARTQKCLAIRRAWRYTLHAARGMHAAASVSINI